MSEPDQRLQAVAWPAVREFLRQQIGIGAFNPLAMRALEAQPPPWLLACSGGADSLALVLLIAGHFPKIADRLTIAHFNHRLRGEAADRDEAFVRALAEALGLRFRSGRWNRDETAPVSEATARGARWEFLERVAEEEGCRIILTGHQRTDVAESMLMRLGRGAGTEGLAVPRPVQMMGARPLRVRPLLDLDSQQVRLALQQAGARWREDSSNQSGLYTRNRVRQSVLPALEEALPGGFVAGVGRSRRMIDEAAEAVTMMFEASGVFIGNRDVLDLAGVAPLPAAMVRLALHRWWLACHSTTPMEATVSDAVVEAVMEGRSLQISAGGIGIKVSGRRLETVAPVVATDPSGWSEIRVDGNLSVYFPWGACLRVETVRLGERERARILGGAVECAGEAWLAEADGVLILRQRQAGDSYRPLGAPGRRRVQDCLTDRKIAAFERNQLPVVLNEPGNILWIPGLEPSHDARITAGTEQARRLTYHRY